MDRAGQSSSITTKARGLDCKVVELMRPSLQAQSGCTLVQFQGRVLHPEAGRSVILGREAG